MEVAKCLSSLYLTVTVNHETEGYSACPVRTRLTKIILLHCISTGGRSTHSCCSLSVINEEITTNRSD